MEENPEDKGGGFHEKMLLTHPQGPTCDLRVERIFREAKDTLKTDPSTNNPTPNPGARLLFLSGPLYHARARLVEDESG